MAMILAAEVMRSDRSETPLDLLFDLLFGETIAKHMQLDSNHQFKG